MATTTQTFSFPSNAEGFTNTYVSGIAQNASIYTAGVGNPQGSLGVGRASASGGGTGVTYWSLTTTWEALGVPAGETVTKLRINDGYTKATQITGASSIRFGPYELRDGSGANPSTLLTYRDASSVDGSWVSLGAGSDIDVPSAIQASNSSIQLRLNESAVFAAFGGAVGYFDEIAFTITYGSGTTVALTGVSGTGSVGTVAPSSSIGATGNSSTGSVGTMIAAATLALTQVLGIGSVGNVTPQIPTRFYLPVGVAREVSPVIDPSWTYDTGYGYFYKAVRTKLNTALTQILGYTTSNAGSFRIAQHVSEPLAAQTISGYVKGQIGGTGYINNSHYPAISIRVCSNDGTTIRGTLLSLKSSTAAFPDTPVTNRSFKDSTTTPIALTSVAIQDGDRLVIEIGISKASGGTGEWGSFSYLTIGDNYTDEPENETTTGGYNPWIEFDSTISPSPNITKALTQVSGTGSVGSLSKSLTVPINGNIGTGSVGTLTTGVEPLTGVNADTSVGIVTPSTDSGSADLSGVNADASIGNVAVSVTGGTCTLGPITGNYADGSVGEVIPNVASTTPSIVTVGGVYYNSADIFTSPETFSFDGTGSNYLVVLISCSSFSQPQPTITGVTFNDTGLTSRGSAQVNDNYGMKAEIWTLASPASGVHDIVMSWTGNIPYGFSITAIGLKDVTAIDQTVAQHYHIFDSAQPKEITVNSTAYDLCLAVLTTNYVGITPSAGQDEPGVHAEALFLRHRVGIKRGQGASTTLGWTTDDNTYSGALVAISLSGVGPASNTVALTGNIAVATMGYIGFSQNLTGVAATGSVGTMTPSIGWEAALTGNIADGSVGYLEESSEGSDATLDLTGVSGTGSIGSFGIITDSTLPVTGNEAIGSVGGLTASASESATIALTGVLATGVVGLLTSGKGFAITGVAATGSVGSINNRSFISQLIGNNAFGLVGRLTPPSIVEVGTWKRGSGHLSRSNS